MHWGPAVLNTLLRDGRFAVFSLLRQPQATAAAVVALALGIGASIAIFSVVYAIALQPLPFPEADRVLQFRTISEERTHGGTGLPLSFAREWAERSPSFAAVAAYSETDATLTGFDRPERVHGSPVAGDFFRVLGVPAQLGRTFSAAEVAGGEDRVVVLSHAFWLRRFSGEESVLGRGMELDGETYSVIGVMPADFIFPDPTVEFWRPMQWTLGVEGGEGQEIEMQLPVIGRLAADVSLDEALQRGQVLLGELEQQVRGRHAPRRRQRGGPPEGGSEVSSQPEEVQEEQEAQEPTGPASQLAFETLLEQQVAPVRPAIRVLSGAVALLLLIACANVANLQLARGVGRRRELATRAALGASGTRMASLLLVESVVLAALGGALGCALAAGALRLLRWLDPGDVPRLSEASLSLPVLGFAVAVVLLSAVLFGLLPIAQVLRGRLELGREALASGRVVRRLGGRGAGGWVRGALAVAEVSLALVLLIGAGLLAASFSQLLSIDPGYDPATLTAYVPAPLSDYPAGPARTALYDGLLERVRALPTVQDAGYVNFLPLFSMRIVLSVQVEGSEQPSDPRDTPSADLRIVSDGYFEAMGIPLREGRLFDARDREGGVPALVVNETFARELIPDGTAVGERVAGFGEIIGVVGDVRIRDLDQESSAAFYVPTAQMPPMLAGLLDRFALAVRTEQPAATAEAVRAALFELDPNIPLHDVATMEERLRDAVAQPRFFTAVLAVFSVLAVGLALVGVYSVLSFARTQETRQIGIRMALGAQPADIARRALFGGVRLVLVGIALGIPLSLAASRLLESFLYGVQGTDPVTYAVVAGLLALTGVLASYLPARRAARVDPVLALRAE